MLTKIKDKAVELAKAFYATPTGYRLVWTSVQLGAGAAAVAFGANPAVGVLVTIATTAITSIARERLASSK
jgi:hypothetical protein